jgi:hypothetical protein
MGLNNELKREGGGVKGVEGRSWRITNSKCNYRICILLEIYATEKQAV